eukprot:15097531-Alexandrium_andersonii.AAC.1
MQRARGLTSCSTRGEHIRSSPVSTRHIQLCETFNNMKYSSCARTHAAHTVHASLCMLCVLARCVGAKSLRTRAGTLAAHSR